MSVHEPTPFRASIPSVDADRAVKFGVGVAAAPLWATFFTAAGAGLAYWWLTAAWTRREGKSFAPAASDAAPTGARAPVAVRTEEPAPRRAEPVAAPEPARTPAAERTPAPEPAPAVEVHPRPQAAAPGTLAAAAPVAAGLEPVVEPSDIAAAVEHPKPAQAASRAEGAKAEAPATGPRKPPVKRKPEAKA